MNYLRQCFSTIIVSRYPYLVSLMAPLARGTTDLMISCLYSTSMFTCFQSFEVPAYSNNSTIYRNFLRYCIGLSNVSKITFLRCFFLRTRVNLINILEAFLQTQIPRAQKNSQVVSLFALLGSAPVKAARRRTLMKLTPGVLTRFPKQELNI